MLGEVFPEGAEHGGLTDLAGEHQLQDFLTGFQMYADVLGGLQMLAGDLPYTGGHEAVAVVVAGAGVRC